MNPFDMAVVVILGYSIIHGLFRGIIRELAAIFGLIGGFYIAYSQYHSVAPVLAKWIANPLYRNVIGFLLLFCIIFAAATLLGLLLRALFRMVLLGVLDRIFGALFGAVKGAVIVGILFFLLTTFLPRGGAAVVRQSRLAPVVNSIAVAIAHVIPKSSRDAFEKKMEALKQKWEGPAISSSDSVIIKKTTPAGNKTGD